MSTFIKQYSILFEGLKAGNHYFRFKMDDSFFSFYQNPESLKGQMKVEVEMDKKSDLLALDLKFSGFVSVICDKCLEYFEMPMNFRNSLFIKFIGNEDSGDIEVIYLEPGETRVNLAGYFIESILLQLPLKRVHPSNDKGESLCNKKMIDILEGYSKTGSDTETDPRWDALKKLMNN